MATIALYAGKLNQMPGLIKDAKKSVDKLKTELSDLQKKAYNVDTDVCDLSEVISSIQASAQTQENRIAALENFQTNSEEFINEVIRIDNHVADTVNQNKENFYKQYDYLKPECEKSGWEKFCDGLEAVGEWCQKHWKLIVTVVVVVVAVVLIVATAGATLGPMMTILLGAAKGLVAGAAMGGLIGGVSSVASGGSFLEGFENGAFNGAITGAFMGGLGAAGSVLGGSCSFAGTAIGRLFDTVIPMVGKIAGGITGAMGLFDTVALAYGLFDPDNALTQLNKKLHGSAAYNVFQMTMGALAVFSGGYMKGTQNRTCFVAGTLVFTACGLIAIENIRVGDKVFSQNTETGEQAVKTVVETYVRQVTELVHLRIDGEDITTTHDHPFYVVNYGFKDAGKLSRQDKLFGNDGRVCPIDDISFLSEETPRTVYNFQVEDHHTYFVGYAGILVHNAGDAYSRPSHYRKGVREKVFEDAKGDDGIVRNPETGQPIDPNKPWDMGHKPGYEFRKHQESARTRGITRQQFLDEYNNPNHYRPELPSYNRSHVGENVTDIYLGP